MHTTTMTPSTSGHPRDQQDPQHTPPMVVMARRSTPTSQKRYTHQPYPKHSPINKRLDVRTTHASHQPRYHIPRTYPHPQTYPTSRGNTITLTPKVRPHGGTRQIWYLPNPGARQSGL
jgi:hypothetical protein